MKELISVIVPIYNQEKYLEQCLNSICSQSYEYMEVLLVNDGSTDRSPEICKQFVLQDVRFHLINKENGGLSSARNAGLQQANGEYIAFIDADDYVDNHYLEFLYKNLVMTQADISMCAYQKFEGRTLTNIEENNHLVVPMTDVEVISNLTTVGSDNISEPMVVCWNKLIRREVLDGIYFKNVLHEDEFLINDFLRKEPRFVWTNQVLYYYRQHDSSIMGNLNLHDIRHLKVIEAYEERLRIFRKPRYVRVYRKVVKSYFENLIIAYLLHYSRDTEEIWKDTIYGKMKHNMLKYFPFMSIRIIWHCFFFMRNPERYRSKYW